jgi:ribose-phosphate pyrophosphokinase
MMKIYTANGELAFKTFDFPDGQPHFELQTHDAAKVVTVEARIKNPQELFQVMMAGQVLSRHYTHLQLDIRYLMAARMDRAIDSSQPFTLLVVAQCLKNIYHKIRILDPHSSTSCALLNAVPVLPYEAVKLVLNTLGDVTIVVPDKGAIERTTLLAKGRTFAYLNKKRDMQTGKITNIEIVAGEQVNIYKKRCLIVDDICDGGATFVEAAKLLHEAGAEEVYLYVTHGIFSKTLPLEGIANIFTTDSYREWQYVPHCSLITIPVSMRNL